MLISTVHALPAHQAILKELSKDAKASFELAMPPVDSDPPHFPISLSHFGLKDTVDEVKKIILHLRPDWHETFDDDDVLDYEVCKASACTAASHGALYH